MGHQSQAYGVGCAGFCEAVAPVFLDRHADPVQIKSVRAEMAVRIAISSIETSRR